MSNVDLKKWQCHMSTFHNVTSQIFKKAMSYVTIVLTAMLHVSRLYVTC